MPCWAGSNEKANWAEPHHSGKLFQGNGYTHKEGNCQHCFVSAVSSSKFFPLDVWGIRKQTGSHGNCSLCKHDIWSSKASNSYNATLNCKGLESQKTKKVIYSN